MTEDQNEKPQDATNSAPVGEDRTTQEDTASTEPPLKADYEVGKGKPPKHTQFGQPGGNRSGRKKKGNRSYMSDLKDELAQTITAREGDREIKVTKQRAIVKSKVNRAMRGSDRAATDIADRLREDEAAYAAPPEEAPLTEAERATLDDLERRLGERKAWFERQKKAKEEKE